MRPNWEEALAGEEALEAVGEGAIEVASDLVSIRGTIQTILN